MKAKQVAAQLPAVKDHESHLHDGNDSIKVAAAPKAMTNMKAEKVATIQLPS